MSPTAPGLVLTASQAACLTALRDGKSTVPEVAIRAKVVVSKAATALNVLQGLGLGGLAFALAAQDTIANLFGSIVVAIDQPFKLGETVKIGASTGAVIDFVPFMPERIDDDTGKSNASLAPDARQ